MPTTIVPSPHALSAERLKQAYSQQERSALLKRILQLGLVGGGVGVAARSALGLRNLMQGPVDVPFVSPGPSTLPVPVLRWADDEKAQQKVAESLSKLAEESASLVDKAVNWGTDTAAKMLPQNETLFDSAQIPLALGAAGGGLMGGWSLTDWLMQRRRASRLQAELQKSRSDYQNALMEQFRASHKTASEANPYAGLDELYDELADVGVQVQEKQANMSPVSMALGTYLASLGLLTGGAAYGTYQWTKSRSDANLLDKAMKERARRLWNRSPQSVTAIPQEVSVSPLAA